jgi:hypothetical protein
MIRMARATSSSARAAATIQASKPTLPNLVEPFSQHVAIQTRHLSDFENKSLKSSNCLRVAQRRCNTYTCNPELSLRGADRALRDLDAITDTVLALPFVDRTRFVVEASHGAASFPSHGQAGIRTARAST